MKQWKKKLRRARTLNLASGSYLNTLEPPSTERYAGKIKLQSYHKNLICGVRGRLKGLPTRLYYFKLHFY